MNFLERSVRQSSQWRSSHTRARGSGSDRLDTCCGGFRGAGGGDGWTAGPTRAKSGTSNAKQACNRSGNPAAQPQAQHRAGGGCRAHALACSVSAMSDMPNTRYTRLARCQKVAGAAVEGGRTGRGVRHRQLIPQRRHCSPTAHCVLHPSPQPHCCTAGWLSPPAAASSSGRTPSGRRRHASAR